MGRNEVGAEEYRMGHESLIERKGQFRFSCSRGDGARIDERGANGAASCATAEGPTHRSSARSAAGCIVATRCSAVAGADRVRHV